jgi:hypothetical protein
MCGGRPHALPTFSLRVDKNGAVAGKGKDNISADTGHGKFALEKAIENLPGYRRIGKKHDNLKQLTTRGSLAGFDLKEAEILCVVRNHFDKLHSAWYRSRTRWILQIDNPRLEWITERKRRNVKMCCALEFSEYIA